MIHDSAKLLSFTPELWPGVTQMMANKNLWMIEGFFILDIVWNNDLRADRALLEIELLVLEVAAHDD
jgi:hypothetical protein